MNLESENSCGTTRNTIHAYRRHQLAFGMSIPVSVPDLAQCDALTVSFSIRFGLT